MLSEFIFHLQERTDRNGKIYLFAPIPQLNSVLFIRPEPGVAGRTPRWMARLKPYDQRKKTSDDHSIEDVWKEEQQ